MLLYENIDQIFPNKLHGPMCIHWKRVLYSVVITRQSNTPISQFNSLCNEFTSVWTMFVYNTLKLFSPIFKQTGGNSPCRHYTVSQS